MSTSAYITIMLPPTASWEPAALLAPKPAEIWGPSAHLVLVSDIAKYVPAGDSPVERIQAVTPSSVDPHQGHVRRLQLHRAGSVYRVGRDQNALHRGDVLVPRSGPGPAVLITEALIRYAFTDQFHALRPDRPEHGAWLWGLLSSVRGQQARQAVQVGSPGHGMSIAALLTLAVPAPDDSLAVHRLNELAEERCTALLENGDQSWWHVRSLPVDGRWIRQISMKDPTVLDQGQPLGELADVIQGRRPKAPARAPTHGALPVMEARVVTGSDPRSWSEEELPRIAPGDVVVQAIGQRPQVCVAREHYVASDSVLVVRVREDANATAVIEALMARGAGELLGMLSTGSVMRHLSTKELKSFPVPDEDAVPANGRSQRLKSSTSLQDRIEQVLGGPLGD